MFGDVGNGLGCRGIYVAVPILVNLMGPFLSACFREMSNLIAG